MSITEIIANLGFPFWSLLTLGVLALFFSSYIKISTVLAILRAGLGVNSIPGAMVTGSLAIVLSFFVMYPYIKDAAVSIDSLVQTKGSVVNDETRLLALQAATRSWRKFLLKNSDPEIIKDFNILANEIDKDVSSSPGLDGQAAIDVEESGKWRILAPAFYVSELREAFATGLSLFLPFLIIDLCVAHVLVSMSVTRLDPLIVSLPFKLLLFVMLDGWSMIAGNLISSYAG